MIGKTAEDFVRGEVQITVGLLSQLNGYNTWSWHRYVLKEETGSVPPQE